ncbi:hypothetical protein [Syntrophotalea acetylenica]|nr:hypothetical protein [Syntrophotalea acetylenica]
MDSINGQMTVDIQRSLGQAKLKAEGFLPRARGEDLRVLLLSIRNAIEDEGVIREEVTGQSVDDRHLLFQSFREFYTHDNFFEEGGPLDSTKDPLGERMSKRLAGFALIRILDAEDALTTGSQVPSLSGAGFLTVSSALIDAWQALSLAQTRIAGSADPDEATLDKKYRVKNKNQPEIQARRAIRQKLLVRIRELSDACVKKNAWARTNVDIAGDIYEEVIAYAQEIKYPFRKDAAVTEGDDQPLVYRIERLIGEAKRMK